MEELKVIELPKAQSDALESYKNEFDAHEWGEQTRDTWKYLVETAQGKHCRSYLTAVLAGVALTSQSTFDALWNNLNMIAFDLKEKGHEEAFKNCGAVLDKFVAMSESYDYTKEEGLL